jgi:SAM-dependent methyltransferase
MPTEPQTVGAGSRPDAVISWFEHTYRTRGLGYLRPPAAYPIYLQLLRAQPGDRLLDVGCGPGLLLSAAVERGVEAVGIDVAGAALALARHRAGGALLLRGSAESLPFPSASFDFVTCIGVLERLSDRRAALVEIGRVLVPGGRICCMVRNAESLSWRLRRWLGRQDHRSHQDAGTLAQWRALFASAGLRIDAVHIDQWWRQRVRRLWRGKPDFRRGEPIARPILPLRCALEFIFLLRQDAAADP